MNCSGARQRDVVRGGKGAEASHGSLPLNGSASTVIRDNTGWLFTSMKRRRLEVPMIRTMRMICNQGDRVVAEWDTETVSSERLAEIETEFKAKMAAGWFAVDITEKRDRLIRQFDPNAEILLIPRVQGG